LGAEHYFGRGKQLSLKTLKTNSMNGVGLKKEGVFFKKELWMEGEKGLVKRLKSAIRNWRKAGGFAEKKERGRAAVSKKKGATLTFLNMNWGKNVVARDLKAKGS